MKGDRERYGRVNRAWPSMLPALEFGEASRAFHILYRRYMKKPWAGKIVHVKGRRYGGWHTDGWCINPRRGWSSLVHSLSHHIHAYTAKREHRASHGTAHASLEHEMITAVMEAGWLDGKLKTAPRARKPQPTLREKRRASVERRIREWTTKRKRAETALKKLKRQLAYYSRPVTGARVLPVASNEGINIATEEMT